MNTNTLLQDTLVEIFSYLDDRSICSGSLVCKDWKDATRDPALWHQKAIVRWSFVSCPSGDWTEYYFKRSLQEKKLTQGKPSDFKLTTLRGNENYITGVCLAPLRPGSGQDLVATSSADCTVRLWIANDSDSMKTLVGSSSAINCLAFTNTEAQLVSGGSDGVLRKWSGERAEQLDTITTHPAERVEVTSIAASLPYVFVGGSDGSVQVCDLRTSRITHYVEDIGGPVHSIQYSTSAGRLLVASNARVLMCDLKLSAAPTAPTAAPIKLATKLAIHESNSCVFWCGADVRNSTNVIPMPSPPSSSSGKEQQAKQPAANQSEIYVASTLGRLFVFDSTDGRKIWDLGIAPEDRTQIAIGGPVPVPVVVGGPGPVPHLPQPFLPNPFIHPPPHFGGLSFTCISGDDRRVVLGCSNGDVLVYDTTAHRLVHTLKGHTGSVNCIQFDSYKVVSGAADNCILVHNARTGQKLYSLLGGSNVRRGSSPIEHPTKRGCSLLAFNECRIVGVFGSIVRVWNFDM